MGWGGRWEGGSGWGTQVQPWLKFMAKSEEELKSLLMKEESGKAGLKLNNQKTKIMASGPITSWQMDGETVKTVTEFIFLSSRIQMATAAMK